MLPLSAGSPALGADSTISIAPQEQSYNKKEPAQGIAQVQYEGNINASSSVEASPPLGLLLKASNGVTNTLLTKKLLAHGTAVTAPVTNASSIFILESRTPPASNSLTTFCHLAIRNRLRSMRPGFQGPVTDSSISIPNTEKDFNNNLHKAPPHSLSEEMWRSGIHTLSNLPSAVITIP